MMMKRISSLDGVRGLAILAVFFHHSLHLKLMWMGVDLFFVLSGFLITGVLLAMKERSLQDYFSVFYERRARRILFPYLLFLLIATLFLGFGWARYWYFYILLTNFLLPFHIPHPQAFDPLWSLAVEEQFYVLWPFAVYFLNRKHLKWLCVFLILLAPTLRALLHFQQHWPIYALTPFRMDLLAAGGLMQIVRQESSSAFQQKAGKLAMWISLSGAVLILALSKFGYTTYGNSRTGNVLIYEASLLICSGCMLFALFSPKARILTFAPLRYLGKISYTFYLVHLGAIEIAFHWLHGLGAVFVAGCLAVGYAALSWHFFESKLLTSKPR